MVENPMAASLKDLDESLRADNVPKIREIVDVNFCLTRMQNIRTINPGRQLIQRKVASIQRRAATHMDIIMFLYSLIFIVCVSRNSGSIVAHFSFRVPTNSL